MGNIMLSIDAEDMQQLRTTVLDFARVLQGNVPEAVVTVSDDVTKKVGRPKKEKSLEKQNAVEVTSKVEVEEEPQAKSTVTLEQVKVAMNAYCKKNGIPAGREVLKSFGAERLSDVKPEHYAAILAKATELPVAADDGMFA